jgi:hypothetical protein
VHPDFDKIKPLNHEQKAEFLASKGDYVQAKSGLWLPPAIESMLDFMNFMTTTSAANATPAKVESASLPLPPSGPIVAKVTQPSYGQSPLAKLLNGITEGLPLAEAILIDGKLLCNCPDCREKRQKQQDYSYLTPDERFDLYAQAIATTLPPEIEKGRERIGQLLAISQGCFETSIENLGRYHGLPRRQRLPALPPVVWPGRCRLGTHTPQTLVQVHRGPTVP